MLGCRGAHKPLVFRYEGRECIAWPMWPYFGITTVIADWFYVKSRRRNEAHWYDLKFIPQGSTGHSCIFSEWVAGVKGGLRSNLPFLQCKVRMQLESLFLWHLSIGRQELFDGVGATINACKRAQVLGRFVNAVSRIGNKGVVCVGRRAKLRSRCWRSNYKVREVFGLQSALLDYSKVLVAIRISRAWRISPTNQWFIWLYIFGILGSNGLKCHLRWTIMQRTCFPLVIQGGHANWTIFWSEQEEAIYKMTLLQPGYETMLRPEQKGVDLLKGINM